MIKRKVVFLDRDGVIVNNSEHYYIYRIEDMKYNSGVFEKLKEFATKGFEFILISNQSGIAKGEYKISDTEKIHQQIKKDFKIRGLNLIDDYFCPHHPTKSKCLCRKPNSLMIEKAIAKWNVDSESSFMIGDSDSDVKAAEKAGLKAFKIEPNKGIYI